MCFLDYMNQVLPNWEILDYYFYPIQQYHNSFWLLHNFPEDHHTFPFSLLFVAAQILSLLYFLHLQGNLLEGIVIWFVKREGIEPTKRVFNYVLFSHFSHFLWENQMIQNRNFLHGRNFFVKGFFFVLCTTDWTALTQVTIPLSNLPWFILSKVE